ncbi:MAG: PilZ domain-containing protein [Methylovulum sp.]|nr:PilZ domain-containing protein [Methylovulum sp.]
MNTTPHDRPYRKAITSHGWIFLGGEAREITIKNISITGALAQLDGSKGERTLQNLLVSKAIDFYLPQLQLSGEAKVVRVDTAEDDHIILGLEFQNIAHTANEPVFKRKSYRKDMVIPGHILLNAYRHDFMTVNMSLDGLMIRVPEQLTVEKDAIIPFEFADANLKGFVKVVWVRQGEHNDTLIGLQYVKSKQTKAPQEAKLPAVAVSHRNAQTI